MKSSDRNVPVNLTRLKKAYSVGDRDAVRTEITKRLVKNEVSFYSAWWKNGKSNITSTTIEYKKDTLQHLKAFFTWYFRNSSQTHFTDNMLNQAWDMFLTHAQQIDALQQWGHRKYPTPLEFIYEENPNNMTGCFNKISNYLSARQEVQKFTIEELFHLSLHAIVKLNSMQIKSKKLQEIIEKIILWLADLSVEYLDIASRSASELAFYYRQANPTTTLHEMIANKNPRYDQHGNIIPLICSDHADGRNTSSGYQLPLFLQQLLNVDGRGSSTGITVTPSDSKFDEKFIAKVAKNNGEIMQHTICSNARTLYTLILLKDGKNKQAQNYYRKNVIKYSGEAKEQSICWYCEHLPSEDKSEKQVDLQCDLEEFRQAAQQYIDFQSIKKRYKNTGPKLAKLPEHLAVSAIAKAKPSNNKDTSAHIWKEAERIAKQDSPVDTSNYQLYYYQGSGSRVHFIVRNANGEKITGFTHHMDHEKKLEQQITEQRNELIRFGIALSSAQEMQEQEEPHTGQQLKLTPIKF